MIAGFENPLVAYARKDTPPGLKVPTDIMKASDFKALSLNLRTATPSTSRSRSICSASSTRRCRPIAD